MGVRFVGKVASKSVLYMMVTQCMSLVSKNTNAYVSILSCSVSLLDRPTVVYDSRGLLGSPPVPLTSQQRTVQSEPPLTSTEDSALKARLYIDAVCPVIFLIRRPEPRSHRLMARSSPGETFTSIHKSKIDRPYLHSLDSDHPD